MKASRFVAVLLIGASLALPAGCSSEVPLAAAEEAPGTPASAGPATGASAVTALQTERTTLRRTTVQPATVHPYHQAEVRAKLTGYLDELRVDIGDEVQAGDVLGVLAVPELERQLDKQKATVGSYEAEEARVAAELEVSRAQVTAARAGIALAKADLRKREAALEADRSEHARTSGLVARQAVADRLQDESQRRYDSSQAAVEAANAAIDAAEANLAVAAAKTKAAEAAANAARAQTTIAREQFRELEAMFSYTRLVAPFAGVVTDRNVDPGDLVERWQSATGMHSRPLFTIAQLNRVRVRVAVPENDAVWLDVGDAANITLRSLPGPPIPAAVTRIARSLDEATRTMLVEVDLENPDRRLTPGMFGQCELVLEERADSLVLPSGAVRFDESGRSYLLIVSGEDTVAHLDVTTGLDSGSEIEIVSGLTGKERVIRGPATGLRAGQHVRVRR